MKHLVFVCFWLTFLLPIIGYCQSNVIKKLAIYFNSGERTNAEKAAVDIFSTELKKRTGLQCTITSSWPRDGNVIVLRKSSDELELSSAFFNMVSLPQKPESFRLLKTVQNNRIILFVEGSDGRGVLYGVGKLLRIIDYQRGSISLPAEIAIAGSPEKAIRGHQLGYRNTANSYDGWSIAQYDQYIRDLVIFGTNSIEAIPFFDQKLSPHFKVPPAKMNAALSSICKKYDLDFWMWVPAQLDLTDNNNRKKYIDTLRKTLIACERVDALFFPGGDPGDNAPQVVLPILEEIAVLLRERRQKALIWLSLQGYSKEESQFVYNYIRENKPTWLGGLVTGPGSPPVAETRAALPSNYKLRYYPDITHNVRCEFPVRWWDPAFNFTLGREATNPRPYEFGSIYRALAPYIDGFISYSDGIHDDVNKIIWTALSWDIACNEREILLDYSHYFFGSSISENAADGILALEKNWDGPIESNGSIEASLIMWQQMDQKETNFSANWRWQLCVLRSYYDAYTRARYLYENCLEQAANQSLLNYKRQGVRQAIEDALGILAQAQNKPIHTAWRNKIVLLCKSLFEKVALQTSVTQYQASGYERGAILDFIDRPLNNQWWIEDECKKIMQLPEQEQAKALEILASWENPGEGSFYDDVGNVSKSSHVVRGESWMTDPLMLNGDPQGFDWWENGFSRKRLSWMSNMRWPQVMKYDALDTTASYTVRLTGFGESLLRANGTRIAPSIYGKGIGEIKEFPLPKEMTRYGKLKLTWDDINEDNINWRLQSRVTEVWLIKDRN